LPPIPHWSIHNPASSHLFDIRLFITQISSITLI
jgi:hypothetical protein